MDRPLHDSLLRRSRRTPAAALLAALLLASVGVWWYAPPLQSQRGSPAPASELTYYCPMHPDFQSHEPGSCPVCSMKLVPLEAGPSTTGRDLGTGTERRTEHATPRIQIASERLQQIGVRFATVARQPATVEIRAVGRVAFDETQITHVHSKVSGWIEEVFVDFVGAPVQQGQPLFSIYSPDLVASQQEYLLALRARRELGQSAVPRVAEGAELMLQNARQRLRLWDMTLAQIRALEQRGEISRTVTVFARTSGVVTERAAYHHGRYVTPELDLYTIVPLDRVWVLARVYESEIPHVRVGQRAQALLPYDPQSSALAGSVTFVAPFLDPQTRTLEVRMEFANADGALRPESFVNVLLREELGSELLVPRDAVLDTGTLQYVFVDHGAGSLEPRPIRVGAPVAEGQIVLEGLAEGERVVSAAGFILDSESRLKGAFDAMTRAPSTDLQAR